MMSFVSLSTLSRALFAFWALLLCLSDIGSAVLATVRKRYRFTVSALVLFAPVYIMWQVIFDLTLPGETETVSELSSVLGGLPRIYWLIVFLILTAATVLLLVFNIRYDRTYITPETIKVYLDKIPCGICCWRDNGRVLFSNDCMNGLCMAITGSSLLNGNHFRDAVPEGIGTVDAGGKVWRFACREIASDGEKLYEMIASDITFEYAKTEALKKDKAELSRLNKELREYYLSIDESVQKQEILQAKMNIHDEMNRLMLSTVAADTKDTQALDNIFSLWEQNALLLCMEADKNVDQYEKDTIDSLADALGIQVVWNGELPAMLGDKKKELFFLTAKEAIINALKHAQAGRMEISFEQMGEALSCYFTNDGKLPSGEVRFEGGLANIALLAGKQGASVHVNACGEFTLELRFEQVE